MLFIKHTPHPPTRSVSRRNVIAYFFNSYYHDLLNNRRKKRMRSIAVIMCIFGAVVHADAAQASADTSKFTIENCVNIFNPSKVDSTAVGYQYWFVNKQFLDGRTLKMSVVAPHKATHAPHQHKEDEFFFVLEGQAEFVLNGETKTAGPYASFYCPSGSLHGIRNAGDTVLKYLVIKKYGMNQ
jgi:mannose-6-phosphate isomerase-like protein (cupin superfamily)